MSKIYRTPVLREKQVDFLSFLRNLGITEEECELTDTRKDYCFYEINLSNKDTIILSELNNHQVDFL